MFVEVNDDDDVCAFKLDFIQFCLQAKNKKTFLCLLLRVARSKKMKGSNWAIISFKKSKERYIFLFFFNVKITRFIMFDFHEIL